MAALPDAIRAALNFGGPLPPAPVPGEPVLGEPVAPIATLDELAEAIAAHVAEPWHVRDERIMDAVLRHCDQPFDDAVAAVRADVAAAQRDGYAGGVLHVAAAWLTGTPADARDAARRSSGSSRPARAPRAARPRRCSRCRRTPAAGSRRRRSSSACARAARPPTRSSSPRRCCGSRPRAAMPRSRARRSARPPRRDRCAARSAGRRCRTTGPPRSPARAVREPPLTPMSDRGRRRRAHVAARRADRSTGPLGEYLATATGENEPHGRFAERPARLAAAPRHPVRRALLASALQPRTGRAAVPAAERYLELLTREGEPLAPLTLRLAMLRAVLVRRAGAPERRRPADRRDRRRPRRRARARPARARGPAARAHEPARPAARRRSPSAGPLQRAVVRDLLDASVDVLAALPPRTTARCSCPSTSCARRRARA